MRPIGIDFSSRRRRVSAWGLLWLLAGLALAAVAVLDYQEAQGEADAAASRLQRLARKGGAAEARGTRAQDGRAAEARRSAERALVRLHAPWDDLLRELELAADATVALTAIESEARGHTLRLTGEAKSIGDALAFAARLRESILFDEVSLVGHEFRQAGAVRVVGFTLQAAWSGAL